MMDQANQLRELMRHGADDQQNLDRGENARLIVLVGGKGGVGTTTVAVNLAVALSQAGRAAVLVDANPVAADATLTCGLDPEFGISQVFAGWRSANETLQQGPAGLRVLPQVWGEGQASAWAGPSQERIVAELTAPEIGAEFVVVDAGSGQATSARMFWRAADLLVVVTLPDPNAIMDAYSTIKVLSDDGPAPALRTLVNQASDTQVAADVHGRLARTCHRFLRLCVADAGYLPIHPACRAGGPAALYMIEEPNCAAALSMQQLAALVIETATHPEARAERTAATVGA